MIIFIQMLCWLLVEFVIVFVHISLMMQLLGDDAFLKNTPMELANKILFCIISCALTSGIIGMCFLRLVTM